MKRITFITIITLFAVSLLTNNALAKEKKNEKTTTFKVSIDCHHCVKKIQDNISYEKGVKDLKVSLEDKECTVTYRTDKTDEAKLIKAFNKLGYKAEVKDKADGTKSHQEGHKH